MPLETKLRLGFFVYLLIYSMSPSSRYTCLGKASPEGLHGIRQSLL